MSPIVDQNKHVPSCSVAQAAPSGADGAVVEDVNVVLPPSLRPDTLTAQEAQRLRLLLDDPNQPRSAGSDMPTADGSVLLNKAR